MFAILVFVCLWMIFKDSNKQCPECKGRLKLYERVVRSVGEGRCGVADKYLCRRCGKHWVVRHISTLGNYYVGVWHGGKEGWGAKAYSSVETQPFLGNVNNDGHRLSANNAMTIDGQVYRPLEHSDYELYDPQNVEPPLENKGPIEETSTVKMSHVLTAFILIIVLIFAIAIICDNM